MSGEKMTTAASATGSGRQVPSGHLSGALPSGATWVADVPATWNGVLILYSHGYRPPLFFDRNDAQNAPHPRVAEVLVLRGYALAGSSYAGLGWVMDSAVDDQRATLTAVEAVIGVPRVRIAYGTSMGGIVTSRLVAGGGFDGAITACGALAGACAMQDDQLHGDFAVAQLLLDEPAAAPLTGFAGVEEALASAKILTEGVARGLGGAAGRARFALAAALYHLPGWYGGPKPA
jgi:hypothetical protein